MQRVVKSKQALRRLVWRVGSWNGGAWKTAALAVILVTSSVQAFDAYNPKGSTPPPGGEEEAPIISLKRVPVPGPSPAVLKEFVQDKKLAIQLGKALFWDTRVGSDNKTACATCHFNAGADNRVKNQLNPGSLAGDKTFQLGGPNYQVKASDFPFTRHADINNPLTRFQDKNDVLSSQGVFTEIFNSISASGKRDKCTVVSDAVFHGGAGFNLNGVNTRRVEARHAPSNFNAVFNFRNFWDGRANNTFNAGDVSGLRNPGPLAWKLEQGILRQVAVAVPSSSLASQAVAPPVSGDEMSCRGRSFANLGRKLIGVDVLADQYIHPDDSVLGPLARRRATYESLIKKAFQPDYWQARTRIPASVMGSPIPISDVVPAGSVALRTGNDDRSEDFSQMEANFDLFFGLAVQLYQTTLISDETPFDRYAEGKRSALNQQQIRGLEIFRGAKANCVHCHGGAEFTSASFSNLEDEGRLDSREGANNTVFRYDNGFFNTGVRPTAEDPGVGGHDPFNNPLSETRIAQLRRFELLGNGFDIRKENPVAPDALTAVDGAFKTPGLRNVELTGPYFHNGGKSTLMQVVDFYNRGGDFGKENQPVTDPTIRPLGLVQSQKDDLVAFLLALTDERVRFQKAPFDHPSICVPDGHVGNDKEIKGDSLGNAVDVMRCIPAVGASGARAPLRPFLGLSPFQH